MFCRKCGEEHGQGANYCSACGVKLYKKRKIFTKLLLAGVSAVVLGTGITVLAVNVPENKAKAEIEINTEPDKIQLIKEVRSKVFTILTEDGQGSGFLYNNSGGVITNAHVVAGYSEVSVADQDGRQSTGKVIGISDFFDIALIQVDDFAGKKPLEIGKYRLDIGAEIIAFGSPEGLKNTASVGFVTGDTQGAYQFDAQISYGSSGGPLLDASNGKVLGIVTGYLDEFSNFPYANPFPSFVPMIERWIESPMTPEEVEAVKFPEEWTEEMEGTAEMEEVDISNFIHSYRTFYEWAANSADLIFLEDYLLTDSDAYEKLSNEIDEFIGEKMRLKLISTTVDQVKIEGEQAIVTVMEKTELIRSGKSEIIERTVDYTVIIDEYGYFIITDFIEQ